MKTPRKYYAKEYNYNGRYHDFFGYFEVYAFYSKRKRDKWVNAKPYKEQRGRMIANANDTARDIHEHKVVRIRESQYIIIKTIDKDDIKWFIKRVIKNNPWINGNFAASDGDIMAIITYPEKFEKPIYVQNLKTLYDYAKSGTGTFVWKNVVLFCDQVDFGIFVYRYPEYRKSIEHLTVDTMTYKKFADIIQRISYTTY